MVSRMEWKDRLLLEKRNIAIWGTGRKAQELAPVLQLTKTWSNPFHVQALLESDAAKMSTFRNRRKWKLPVLFPHEIRDWKEWFVIVAINGAWQEVKSLLEEQGLREEEDFVHWEQVAVKVVLGISGLYHDSAAALLVNGEIVAAAQEERFTRKKHDASFPLQAVRYCLREAGVYPGDLDAVVYYDNPFLTADRLFHNIAAAGTGDKGLAKRFLPALLRNKIWIHEGIRQAFGGHVPKDRVCVVEHHLSHAASAFYPSPFDEAAVATIDGVGEWATTAIGRGRGNYVELLEQMEYPHSLGLLYSAFTYFCGFKVNSGEYKLMGLAPYGKPIYCDLILEKLVHVLGDGSFRLALEYFDFWLGGAMTNERFAALFGGKAREPESPITQREMDLAASIQRVTEDIVLGIARRAKELVGSRNLCLAGGVALNCVANGRLLREGPFDHIWIQPAAGDAGGALGAAQYLYYRTWDRLRNCPQGGDMMRGSYLGPGYTNEEIFGRLDGKGYDLEDFQGRETELWDAVADLLVQGRVVGLFQGRMEFGPRALGNRSILANPMLPDMQSRLNRSIKFRESFRPFAPAVLAEHVRDCFEMDMESPYMLLTAQVRKELRTDARDDIGMGLLERTRQARSSIPAVTHLDWSARVQTVTEEQNPVFYHIIQAFYRRTGCPVVVNTSFNVRGEPIVCSPSDACRCFRRTGMDALAMGSFLLRKSVKAEENGWEDGIYALD